MRFLMLGSVELHGESGVISLGGTRQSSLVAALLLTPRHGLSTAELAAAVWGEEPLSGPADAVRASVLRLRKSLDSIEFGGGQRLVKSRGGYSLTVQSNECDVTSFAEHVGTARKAAGNGDFERAVAEFQRAIELWRGPALAGARGPFARMHAARLNESKLEVLGEKIELELKLGKPGALAELRALTSEHRTHEGLHAQLMAALYRSGQPAAALAVFHTVRRELVEQVGAEPGPVMRDLQQRILAHDPGLLPASVPAPARGAAAVVTSAICACGRTLSWPEAATRVS
ncbi:AfsR/SARP family transcriptional regulator [Amycolatopsis sp.]|uniref:AfsR/SARP family transcriptional regulator n=1 Tax=Amycolatopsis sp. TaxID=37632 RepID=UPI002D80567D|nr:BTAD domain-containing putative transcriptional regulator [Amycolatopsis sp.]HET6711243.1 BTAD domain-containing putative transcriptional regulator [Amycolatopsis sp.]